MGVALARLVDHTLLDPAATITQLQTAVAEALTFGCASVCVQPAAVQSAVEMAGGRVAVCSVVGFPHGANLSETKAVEAAGVVARGAVEVDMVADLRAIAEGDGVSLAADVARVRAAVPHVVLKVIIEAALWDHSRIRLACEAAIDGGAEFVKTSTGFHPSGGADVRTVALMRDVAGARARVKASGGIRTYEEAVALVGAGADRLGLSRTAAILEEVEAG